MVAAGGTFRHAAEIAKLIGEMKKGTKHRVQPRYGDNIVAPGASRRRGLSHFAAHGKEARRAFDASLAAPPLPLEAPGLPSWPRSSNRARVVRDSYPFALTHHVYVGEEHPAKLWTRSSAQPAPTSVGNASS